jgi:hypothetical protein
VVAGVKGTEDIVLLMADGLTRMNPATRAE